MRQSLDMLQGTRLRTTIPAHLSGYRLDQALAVLFPQFSRSRIQQWIRDGRATVDTHHPRPRDKVVGGEQVELMAEFARNQTWDAQPLPLSILHEDEELIVVNKPAGLVVHPGAGNRDNTLANALLYYDPELAGVPRAGVVHRLDKDTTGVLVIARTLYAHKELGDQIKRRSMRREYEAIASGRITAGGNIDAPIGRHRVQRTHMAVVSSGRNASTRYRIRTRFRVHTHVCVTLGTGRTHQIRVHMAHIGHPLVGDPVYGKGLRIPSNSEPGLARALRDFNRQALHAAKLELEHPISKVCMSFTAPLPDDMRMLLQALSEDASRSP